LWNSALVNGGDFTRAFMAKSYARTLAAQMAPPARSCSRRKN
jgi:hypothetical protein